MGFQHSWLNISMSSMVILAASVFEISRGKSDRDKHIKVAANLTHITLVGVGNKMY